MPKCRILFNYIGVKNILSFFAEMATAKPVYLLPCFSVFLLLLKLSVLINNLLNNIYAKLLVMEEVAKIKKLVSFSW